MRQVRDADETFATHSFPSTSTELVEAYGELEFELPNGVVTLGEVLEPLPEETFESADDARMAIYGALGEEAIGRKGYSDRDPTCPGEDGHEPISL